jgi:hypothetical protein
VRRSAHIKAALDSEDIEGLLAIGCPPDEYDSEANRIDSRITGLRRLGDEPLGESQVERIVADVWNEMFGSFSDEDFQKRQSAFTSVARKIVGA